MTVACGSTGAEEIDQSTTLPKAQGGIHLVVSAATRSPSADTGTYPWRWGDTRTFDGPTPGTYGRISPFPHSTNDWTHFDIGRVVRLFRTNQPGAIRLSLRKLHVRWWHASVSVMTKFLDRVGVPQRVLDLIPEIVQTCQVCRTWAKPGPDHACSVEIPDKFK